MTGPRAMPQPIDPVHLPLEIACPAVGDLASARPLPLRFFRGVLSASLDLQRFFGDGLVPTRLSSSLLPLLITVVYGVLSRKYSTFEKKEAELFTVASAE